MNKINEDIEYKINEIGGKIEILKSVMRALNSALFGMDELEERDGYTMASVLEEKINEITAKHNELVDKLKI